MQDPSLPPKSRTPKQSATGGPSPPVGAGSPADAQAPAAEDSKTLRRLLRDQEHDRRLLALDLHDGLMQYLIGALLYLDGLHDRPEPLDTAALQQLNRARSLLRQAVGEGRRLIKGVRPPIIDERGLAEALNDLVAENQSHAPIKIELQLEPGISRYSPLLEGMAYRIVQEALTNIQRHSQSARAVVRVFDDGDGLWLEIQDWGIGFDVDKIGGDKYGLAGIRERSEWLGGRCEIASSPGHGTMISVRLPISASSADIGKHRST